ncbi:MAG: acetylglutamate kinase [Verrucomicrobiota bacterium]
MNSSSQFVQACQRILEGKNRVLLIKYGGSAMEDSARVDEVLDDIALIRKMGWNLVIVHGGGKAISKAMQESGLQPQFVDGLRVTDDASMKVVEKTLDQHVNPEIVQKLKQRGIEALSVSGKSVLKAEKLLYYQEKTGKELDLGQIGDVSQVEVGQLSLLLDEGKTPVISPVGLGDQGQSFNINADIAAAKIGAALKVDSLIFLSDVRGILRNFKDPETLISDLNPEKVSALKKEGIIDGGMIPKVDSAVQSLRDGAKKIYFLDGRHPHVLIEKLWMGIDHGTTIQL